MCHQAESGESTCHSPLLTFSSSAPGPANTFLESSLDDGRITRLRASRKEALGKQRKLCSSSSVVTAIWRVAMITITRPAYESLPAKSSHHCRLSMGPIPEHTNLVATSNVSFSSTKGRTVTRNEGRPGWSADD
eukprot:3025312-Rhodomonas_salina.1